MLNFRSLAPLVWEENEMTDSRKDKQNVLAAILNEISNFSLASLGRDYSLIKM